jgi:hypothetical protein
MHAPDRLSSLPIGLSFDAGLAETMGTQLQTQNHKLDRLGNSVDSVSNKLQNQNSTMRKILRD